METVRIGVICPSEIAFRRFMPALEKDKRFAFAGIAYATEEEWGHSATKDGIAAERKKAEGFLESYGGNLYTSYEELICSKAIDAVYLPLPPALHYPWAKAALQQGKHCLVEKPFTLEYTHTVNLAETAEKRGLALHENYMFAFHSQLEYVREAIRQEEIGDLRLIRISFGFPFRSADDFRYHKEMGGGALFDCGGYTLKLAQILLGETAVVETAHWNGKAGFDVDIYGNAVLCNAKGVTAQVSFGMDNAYQCSLELWGSRRTLYTNRILTAPAGFSPTITYFDNNGTETIVLPPDDTFAKSLSRFYECISDGQARRENIDEIKRQAKLVEEFKEKAGKRYE